MKKMLLMSFGYICLFLIIAVLPNMVVWAETAPKSKPIVLKGATMFTQNDTNLNLWEDFWNRVKDQSKGELTMNYFGGPEAVPPLVQPQALHKGVVDVILTVAGYLEGTAPELDVAGISEINPWEEEERGWNDLMNQVSQKKLNAYFLGRAVHPLCIQLYTKKKVKTPYDLSGQKIRSSRTYIPFLKALGCAPVVIQGPEIYTALEKGLVDGTIWGWTGIIQYSWYEVCKYAIEPPLSGNSLMILVNLNTWNSLPKHLQDLLKNTHRKLLREKVNFYNGLYEKEREQMVKNGMEIIKFSPVDAKHVLDLYVNSKRKHMQDNIPGLDPRLLDLIRK